MSSLALKFLLVLSLTTGAQLPPLHAQEEKASQRGPDAVARDFYRVYLQSVAADRDLYSGDQALLKRYATKRLLAEINKGLGVEGGIESDPFLRAQDCDKQWWRNIATSKPVVAAGVATVVVTLKGREMGTHKLIVKLRQEEGSWKVDAVKAP
jgi:hypothetical protein